MAKPEGRRLADDAGKEVAGKLELHVEKPSLEDRLNRQLGKVKKEEGLQDGGSRRRLAVEAGEEELELPKVERPSLEVRLKDQLGKEENAEDKDGEGL